MAARVILLQSAVRMIPRHYKRAGIALHVMGRSRARRSALTEFARIARLGPDMRWSDVGAAEGNSCRGTWLARRVVIAIMRHFTAAGGSVVLLRQLIQIVTKARVPGPQAAMVTLRLVLVRMMVVSRMRSIARRRAGSLAQAQRHVRRLRGLSVRKMRSSRSSVGGGGVVVRAILVRPLVVAGRVARGCGRRHGWIGSGCQL